MYMYVYVYIHLAILGNLGCNEQSVNLFLIVFYSSLHGSLQYCPVKLKMLIVNHDNFLKSQWIVAMIGLDS